MNKKKNNDLYIINEIKSSKINQSDGIKVDKKINSNVWINKIIDFLRKNNNTSKYEDITKEFKEFENFFKNNPDFLEYLHNSNKLNFDMNKRTFELKSKYDLKNIIQLKQKIQSLEYGIIEDEELLDSYPGIKSDLNVLKNENFVKQIYNEEKKCNVLFYRDTNDEIEKIIIDPKYENALKELRKIWNKDLDFFTNEKANSQNNFIRKRARPDGMNSVGNIAGRKKQRKRRQKAFFANSHLLNVKNNSNANSNANANK